MRMSCSPLLLVAAAAVTLVATPTLAQQARDAGAERYHGMHMRGGDLPDRGWSNDERRDWRSDTGRRDRASDRSPRDDDEDDDRGASKADNRPSRSGATFQLRSGDMRLAVRCGAGESMRACVEAATMLLDRARAAAIDAAPRPGASTPQTTAP